MPSRLETALLGLFLLAVAGATLASETPTPGDGARLEDFDYPYSVDVYRFDSQRQPLEMAYMDVAPAPEKANGRAVLLLHGKNFCAATWEGVIAPLREAGFRVIAPDQIGFCKSSKPRRYQFSFHQLAANTHALLESIGVERPIVMGHSMGGMLAVRYALQYPDQVERLVLANPIGLEDWLAKGVPYRTIDRWYQGQLKTSAEGIAAYQRDTYYAGDWEPRYDRWVEMLARQFEADRDLMAWESALTYDMILTQPVVHRFGDIAVPTLLLIGERDNTAIGKKSAPEAVARTLGDYPALARQAAAAIPDATLITFPELGHSPQIQDPERFNRTLLEQLLGQPSSAHRAQ
ncbi:alpha/beta fold hydrolase [Imhoffiella purpurea]|uniref:2-hydroxy-6-oxo-6-phenylhexa-2,4-dienoate hydrolase n=1 Tax=Imhoffiella purpurea TaxID=1249627 RepID=W9VV37_9GAMM|nr:alpha/beta hydrolase [Imhoffiella purpurea]EXJ14265.1 2-hydroxy-6-oxo-6-phenylhexa-2,4-dienoate hydrolase [Imhoffiella purpurea]